MTLERLYLAALQLPRDARVALADRILASVDDVVDDSGESVTVSAEWMDEIRRRVEALKRGEEQTIDGETVFRRLDERLQS